MNEKWKQMIWLSWSWGRDGLSLSKTSQFYMLIGNEWKMQTNMKTKFTLGLSKTSQFYMLIGNEWKMQTNMKTKLTLLVLRNLSKTSQFYMLIGNEWKMQTIW